MARTLRQLVAPGVKWLPARGRSRDRRNPDRRDPDHGVPTHHRRLGDRGICATTAAWGVNVEHGHGSNGALVETVVDSDERNVAFARVEVAQKPAASLVVLGAGDAERWVGKVAVGYVRQVSIAFGSGRAIVLGFGASVSANAVPSAYESAYGGRWPLGFAIFVSTRPGQMQMR